MFPESHTLTRLEKCRGWRRLDCAVRTKLSRERVKMKPRNSLSRKPAFRWGDVEEWVRTLSGPKIEDLHSYCTGVIAKFEFARSNPQLVWKFESTPDLTDGSLSLGEFVMFKRRLRLDYRDGTREYVLNFAPGPDRAPARKRRGGRKGGKSGSSASARVWAPKWVVRRIWQAAAAPMWYKMQAAAKLVKITAFVIFRAAQAAINKAVRRAPRLRLVGARIRDLFMGMSEPLTCVSGWSAPLAPRVIFIGAGLTLLLHSFERESSEARWEQSLFGELPHESEWVPV